MNSGQSAGISPYDGPAVIINIFIVDNKLSIYGNEALKCFFDPEKHRIEKTSRAD
jgi:hypothetical protein